ncbi:hypothetical protein ABIF65_004122 [Bradyrhizobium japonicum]|uniref:hypothetical protein n=1 Tax=Bradyrhizobium TaxID=374 RepID=UPI001BA72A2A|nr:MULTISPECIES: hypothetical protein [Bradyrhizobium]WLB93712.1 hypothetical protein QIH92_28385 [Bradyrhizobium japonicum USDA 123]MBR0882486.1 hypothetical protein [Bradyrhizobium liaoningense]MBR1002305.1 hypothetical protein [Bradyrhizobium liaoningense]MBR1068584.1 hypothetical protein [Bradyrhizobium liaoningense]MCP1740889.1 hypothetical protein [Bradyrhizobium japonicum]
MSVPFLSVKPRAIKLKVLPQFPARLVGRAGVDVTKQNGDYFIDLDYADFPVIGSVPAGATYALIFNPATGQYAQLPISLLGGGGGGGIPEAPNDGILYGRKSLAWSAVPAAPVIPPVRDMLTAARTYYVRPDGSNANNGLADNAGGAFLTIQKAIDVVASLDLSIYQVTVIVRPGGGGNLHGGNLLKNYVGALAPIIVGDETTPGNVVVDGNGSSAFISDNVRPWHIRGMRIRATSAGSGFDASSGGIIYFQKIDFQTFNQGYAHMRASGAAIIAATGNYTISGDAGFHLLAVNNGYMANYLAGTVPLTGTLNFSQGFAYAKQGGVLYTSGMTFNPAGATVTGPRYAATSNGVIATGGGGANYFPGSIAGSISNGGIYG